MVKAFEEATGKKVNYKIAARRAGDIATCYSDPQKAKNELHWEANKNIRMICAKILGNIFKIEKNNGRNKKWKKYL